MPHRWRSVALGGLLVVACLLLVVREGARRSSSNVMLAVPSAPPPGPAHSFSLDAVVAPSSAPEGPKLPRAHALPPNAPRRVRFGVILIQYRGAQLTSDTDRPRAEAFAMAERLAAVGRVDFARAAKQGDEGSTADAGHLERGILEPGLEYEVFTLEPGAVSHPLDTPRGFWIVRRIE